MAALPFGQFSLLDLRGEDSGAVIIAPELILLRRTGSGAVHDLSYLVVWSEPRTAALMRELQALVGGSQRHIVDASTPELRQVLSSIEPKATAVFRGGGQCPRIFRRRQLKAALQAAVGARRQSPRAS